MAGNSANNSKNKAQNVSTEKVMTKYDRKMAKRREEEKRLQREKVIFRAVGAGVLAGIIIAVAVIFGTRYNRIHNKFISVDGSNISQIEFDMYYNVSKNALMSQSFYGSMTMADYYSYMGYSSSQNDKSQTNSQTGKTWYEYFADNALTTIKEYKALIKDADAGGYEYTTGDDDYADFTQQISDAASDAGKSIKDYYKQSLGQYATESNVKKYVMEYLKANAYQRELTDGFAATDDEIKNYYEENKDIYDQVDYREFTVTAVDSTDGEMEQAKAKADEFAAGATSEQAFIDLCRRNAADGESKYDNDEGSLKSKITSSDMESGTSEWLLSDERNAGDVTVVEDTSEHCYYVLYFISKSYDGSMDETIASNVLNKKYSDYISALTDDMQTNTYNRF